MPRVLVGLLCVALGAQAAVAEVVSIASVAAAPEELLFTLSGRGDASLKLIELAPYEAPDAERAAVWSGRGDQGPICLPRFDGPRDRLYGRFVLYQADDARPLGAPRFVTDVASLGQPAAAPLATSSIKGLQCVVDVEEAIALGVRHVAINFYVAHHLDFSGQSPLQRTVEGQTIAFSPRAIESLDRQVKRFTDAGVRVYLILVNPVSPPGQPQHALVHPHADVAAAPSGLVAFNAANAEGVRALRGVIEFLAERYGRSDNAHGRIADFIFGNEVQSHWEWNNIGLLEPDAAVAEYARALRIADLAARSQNPAARVYVSLDHFWGVAHRPTEPKRGMPGKYLIDRLQQVIAAEGDFPWQVAFHPYPENLRDPRSWRDATARDDFDSPRVTFKNLEVLTTYLRQPRMLYEGQPRRVILSEQGFNHTGGTEGDALQAAGYAYAYQRVKRVEGIDAFILHRHMDHPDEGGLRLGLRGLAGDTPPRKILDLFRAADTDAWAKHFDFAKPLIGISDWRELNQRPIPPAGN